MDRLFIDSDVLIDFLGRRENFTEAANLLALIAEKQVEAYTSPIVLANVHYIVSKLSNKTRSKKSIKNLKKNIMVLTIDESIIDEALESELPDFEDAIQYYTARKNNIHFFITRNKKDYKKVEIKVLSAREYISMYRIDR